MQKCKFCQSEKTQEEFCKKGDRYLKCCKQCHRERYYIPRPRDYDPNKRNSTNERKWKKAVKDRDGNKCQHCGGNNRLAAHHIIPWKKEESKRFDVDNGISLCGACHLIEERKIQQRKSPEHTLFKKGMETWNKGTKGLCKAWNKGKKLEPHEINGKETQFKKGQAPHNKGKKTVPHENSVKTQFKKGESASPATQFEKGRTPWNKGLKMK